MGTVVVQLYTVTAAPKGSVTLQCSYPASVGSAMVPAAMLAELTPEMRGSISISNAGSKPFTIGDFAVVFTAQTPGVSADLMIH